MLFQGHVSPFIYFWYHIAGRNPSSLPWIHPLSVLYVRLYRRGVDCVIGCEDWGWRSADLSAGFLCDSLSFGSMSTLPCAQHASLMPAEIFFGFAPTCYLLRFHMAEKKIWSQESFRHFLFHLFKQMTCFCVIHFNGESRLISIKYLDNEGFTEHISHCFICFAWVLSLVSLPLWVALWRFSEVK